MARSRDDSDSRFWRFMALAGWLLIAIIAGVIGQAVFGWLVPKNTGGGNGLPPVPGSVEKRLSDLELSDRKQDAAIEHLRFDLNNHLKFHGVQIDARNGRPFGSPAQ